MLLSTRRPRRREGVAVERLGQRRQQIALQLRMLVVLCPVYCKHHLDLGSVPIGPLVSLSLPQTPASIPKLFVGFAAERAHRVNGMPRRRLLVEFGGLESLFTGKVRGSIEDKARIIPPTHNLPRVSRSSAANAACRPAWKLSVQAGARL